MAIKVMKKAVELAKKFNKATATPRPIEYVWSDIWKVSESNPNMATKTRTPKRGEWCMVEDYIDGVWRKSRVVFVDIRSCIS